MTTDASRSQPQVIRHLTPVSFLNHAEPWLLRAEAQNNLVLGIAAGLGVFANLWAGLSGREARRGMRQRIHEIRRVQPLGNPSRGGLRPATESDLEILTPWVAGFVKEVGVSERSAPVELVQERLQNRSLFVWDDSGPVSMAAWTGKTPTGVRVNFVYTPEDLRRRGYATACVAALTQLLLDRGNEYCCLYTDLANSTSNAIYQRIGYRPCAM